MAPAEQREIVTYRREQSGGAGRTPTTAGELIASLEPDTGCGQAAFGKVSLTALTLSTTTSLSSEPVSR